MKPKQLDFVINMNFYFNNKIFKYFFYIISLTIF